MMLRLIPAVFLMATLIPIAAAAQEKPRAQTPRVVQPTPKPEGTPATPTRRGSYREVNIQVELTITDFVGSESPDKKVVSVTTADGTVGRIRTSGEDQVQKMIGHGATVLNIDTTPTMLADDRILLRLTLEYAPPPLAASTPTSSTASRRATVNEMLSVVLQNGKSMMVSQAADPTTARRLTVEVKATILK
jgi:hypothetical protein